MELCKSLIEYEVRILTKHLNKQCSKLVRWVTGMLKTLFCGKLQIIFHEIWKQLKRPKRWPSNDFLLLIRIDVILWLRNFIYDVLPWVFHIDPEMLSSISDWFRFFKTINFWPSTEWLGTKTILCYYSIWPFLCFLASLYFCWSFCTFGLKFFFASKQQQRELQDAPNEGDKKKDNRETDCHGMFWLVNLSPWWYISCILVMISTHFINGGPWFKYAWSVVYIPDRLSVESSTFPC